MDLLASSVSSVHVAVARKAVGTWVARRQFGGVAEGPFTASVGIVGSGDQIRAPTTMVPIARVLSARGRKGFGQEQEGGGEKVSMVVVVIGSLG